jgi:TPR repeat protein
MRPLPAVLFTGVLLCAAFAHAAPTYLDPDPDATRRVSAYIDSKDCPGAVKALNDGVKSKQRDVLLLAGAMFETGLCVKENWERAVYFYQLADKAGHKAAIHRLAAGYAVAGRDNALAIWWAAQRPSDLPRSCIPAVDPEKDAEGFAAALARMPVSQFKACVYMSGVYSAIMGETEFPAAAARNGVYGDVTMVFAPAQGAIDWSQDGLGQALGEGVFDGNKANTESRRKVENSLLTYMRTAGARTLARYSKPDGIDPAVRVRQKFAFAYRP